MLLAQRRMKLVYLHAKIMECSLQADILGYALVMDKQRRRDIIRKAITSARTRTHSKRKHLIRQHTKFKILSKVPSNNRIRRLFNQWPTAYRMDFHSEKLCLTDLKMSSNRYHLNHNRIINRKPINHNNINSRLINKHQIINKLIHFNSHRINTSHTNNHLKPIRINHLLINSLHINRMLIKRPPINNQSHKIHF